jgi:prephenate dehydrogenase
MTARFDTVTIIGVGLLGGSLGLSLKERALARRVVGVGRRRQTLDTARDRGAIDAVAASVAESVPDSDLIIICTPAAAVPACMDEVRTFCGKRAAVTDVASTKAEICAHARKAWAEPYRFVGSHPMAGSEKFGPEYADANLYEGSVCFVEAQNNHADDAYAAIARLWECVGAHVVPVDPAEHDRFVARTSHVPHIVSAALAKLAGGDPRLRPFAGRGFRDTTRIAEGRPELWRDICLTNRDAISESLIEVQRTLRKVTEALRDNDPAALDRFFTEGRSARRGLLDE